MPILPIRGSRSRQRGAAAILAAIGMVCGLAAAALAIDLGRLYYAQRELQRVASMSALDAARVAGGCMGQQENAEAAAFAETLGSIERNSRRVATIEPQRVEIGRRRTAADGNRFFETAPEDKNRAVRVVLQRPAPGRLMQITGVGADPGTLTAVAAAYSRPTALVEVGSRLVQLRPEVLNDFLAQALGERPNLDLLSYQNLLGVDVPMVDIIDGVGTPDEILDISLPTRDLLDRVVEAVGNSGNRLALSAAEQIADAAVLPTEVTPAQVLFVEDMLGSSLEGTLVNAGTLMLAVAQAANGSALLDLPVALPPPLGGGSGRLRLVQSGRQADLSPGPASGAEGYAANGQAILETDFGVDLPLVGAVRVPLFVEVAQATATVDEIECARRGRAIDRVVVRARSSISRLGIGRFDDIESPRPLPQSATLVEVDNVELPVVGVLGTTLAVPVRIRIDAYALIDIPSEEAVLEFSSPFPSEPQSIGLPQAAVIAAAMSEIPSNLDLDIRIEVLTSGLPVLPAVLDATLAGVRSSIELALRNQLSDNSGLLADELLAPSLSSLGLTVGGADISVRSVTTDAPELFTR